LTHSRKRSTPSSPNLERKEWLKKGFLLSKECQNYIDSHEYPIRVYLGISLKDRRKEFIPEDLTLSLLDKWTPPFIILSKLQMDDYHAETKPHRHG